MAEAKKAAGGKKTEPERKECDCLPNCPAKMAGACCKAKKKQDIRDEAEEKKAD